MTYRIWIIRKRVAYHIWITRMCLNSVIPQIVIINPIFFIVNLHTQINWKIRRKPGQLISLFRRTAFLTSLRRKSINQCQGVITVKCLHTVYVASRRASIMWRYCSFPIYSHTLNWTSRNGHSAVMSIGVTRIVNWRRLPFNRQK